MKWNPRKECLVSEDNKVLKADTIKQMDNVLSALSLLFPKGFTHDDYQAQITNKALYEDPYQINGSYNHKNEFVGITLESEDNKTTVDFKHLKPFMQKSSKYFVGMSNCPLLVVNKNYIVVISPTYTDKVIRYLKF